VVTTSSTLYHVSRLGLLQPLLSPVPSPVRSAITHSLYSTEPQAPTVEWLFLDLNSYFASVEQQERPELRGRPIGIVPLITEHTCCIAASYEAKVYGVKTGINVEEAKQLCPP
jgi:hypothetical protein